MGGVPNMSTNDIPPAVMNSSIPENAPPGSRGNSVMGPVENSNRNDGIFGKGKEDTVQDSRRMQVGQGNQIYAGCNSMLVQLTDTSGKNKARERREDRLEEKVATLADRASYDDEEVAEVMNAYKTSRPEMIKEMEQARVVGAIESEIGPQAPLMRRYDGTTMRDAVYVQMMADRDSGIAQSGNPLTSGNIFSNPNAVQQSIEAIQALRDKATSFMETFLEKLEEEEIEPIIRPLFVEEGEELAMNELLIVALVKYMRQNGGNGPSPE
ncbi:hypothetical protein B0A55_07961 [Friedmanniomyces simplex]|uniref:Uncharacterized protein n=1 Tax=Friedmanniomyces simplex TaxID=329884 RepID=A0A4U0XF23_9PEZI|nr:hypothetical protein B0A55_07961 [Friedmanniomyces simplex]